MTGPALAATDYSPMDVILRLLALVGAALLLVVIAVWLRKRLLKQDEPPPMGFTLRDLRAMHAAGQLSDEELARAEAASLTRSRSVYMSGTGRETPEDAAARQSADASDLADGSAPHPADHPDRSDPDGLPPPGDAADGDNAAWDGDNPGDAPDKNG